MFGLSSLLFSCMYTLTYSNTLILKMNYKKWTDGWPKDIAWKPKVAILGKFKINNHLKLNIKLQQTLSTGQWEAAKPASQRVCYLDEGTWVHFLRCQRQQLGTGKLCKLCRFLARPCKFANGQNYVAPPTVTKKENGTGSLILGRELRSEGAATVVCQPNSSEWLFLWLSTRWCN